MSVLSVLSWCESSVNLWKFHWLNIKKDEKRAPQCPAKSSQSPLVVGCSMGLKPLPPLHHKLGYVSTKSLKNTSHQTDGFCQLLPRCFTLSHSFFFFFGLFGLKLLFWTWKGSKLSAESATQSLRHSHSLQIDVTTTADGSAQFWLRFWIMRGSRDVSSFLISTVKLVEPLAKQHQPVCPYVFKTFKAVKKKS